MKNKGEIKKDKTFQNRPKTISTAPTPRTQTDSHTQFRHRQQLKTEFPPLARGLEFAKCLPY